MIQFFKPSRIDARDWYFREQNICVCVCVCVRACGERSSGGEGVLRREEERAGRNEDKGVASTPRGPVGASTISSTHVPLRYAYARAYVKDAREAGAAAAFYPVPVQTAKEFRVIYRPVICRRRDSKENRSLSYLLLSVSSPPSSFYNSGRPFVLAPF